jgi:hypothetical protein
MPASARVKSAPVRPASKSVVPRAPGVDCSVVDNDGRSATVGTDVPGQIVGQHRTEKRRVDQPAPEFLSDDGYFDARGPVGAQRSPACHLNLLVQTRNSIIVGEILNRSGSEIVGQLGGCVT